jgi:hypothetical protein
MAILVPLAQLTTAFPPITQVHPVCTCSARRLAIRRFSAPLRVSSGAAISTSLSVWMDNGVGSPPEQMRDLLFR